MNSTPFLFVSCSRACERRLKRARRCRRGHRSNKASSLVSYPKALDDVTLQRDVPELIMDSAGRTNPTAACVRACAQDYLL